MLSLITCDSILQPHQNSVILHAFMDLFCSFVRVNLFAHKASQLHDFLFLVFSLCFNFINRRGYQLYMLAASVFHRYVLMLIFEFADGLVTVAKENDASDL